MTNIEFKPHGYKTLSNSHGIEIWVDDGAEEVVYRFTDVNSLYDSQIRFDQDGDAYFMDMSNTVHYLNEFLKITQYEK